MSWISEGDVIRERLEEVRRRRTAISGATALGQVLAVGVAVLLGVMLVDFLVGLPLGVRALVLLGGLAAGGWWLWGRLVVPWLRPASDDEVALWIEADQPGLRQRLISAVQLSREAGRAEVGSPRMIAALVEETRELLRPADLSTVVRPDGLYQWGGGGLGAALLLLVIVGLGGATTRDLLLRAVCVPGVEVPRKTRVELVRPAELVVPRGEDVTLEAVARGVVPRTGELRVRFEGGADRRFGMSPLEDADGGNRFGVTLRAVTESFVYRARLNDGVSPEGRVRVALRPVARRIEVTEFPPAYTGRSAAVRPTGDLVLLEGSRLSVSAVSSKPLRGGAETGRLMLLGPSALGFPKAYPLVVSGEARDRAGTRMAAGGDVPVPAGLEGLAVVLLDEDGLETRDPTVFRVQVVPDRPPRLRVTLPVRSEDVVTRLATPRIGFEVSDDLGLGSVRLKYRVYLPGVEQIGQAGGADIGGGVVGGARDGQVLEQSGEDATGPSAVQTVDLDIAAGVREVRGFYPWRLVRLGDGTGLPEGSRVEWWLEAADQNNVTGPGVARSERFMYRIGTEAQVRDALMARLTSTFGGLQDSQQSQQDLTRDLGTLILERPLRER